MPLGKCSIHVFAQIDSQNQTTNDPERNRTELAASSNDYWGGGGGGEGKGGITMYTRRICVSDKKVMNDMFSAR